MTQRFWRYLERERDRVVNGWINGTYQGPSGDETLQINAKAIGAVQCIESFLMTEEEDLGE